MVRPFSRSRGAELAASLLAQRLLLLAVLLAELPARLIVAFLLLDLRSIFENRHSNPIFHSSLTDGSQIKISLIPLPQQIEALTKDLF